MDIIDIAIAKSKATAVDPSDISSAVSNYLDEHGVDIETDTTFSQQGTPADALAVGTAQSVAATSQAKYDNINVMKDVQSALTSQIADVRSMEQSILGNQNECCCSTKMLISEQAANTNAMLAQNRYDLSMQLAGVEQRLMSKMDANEIQNLRDQVSQLQMAQATSGVVRYPNSWTFNAGNFPNCFCGGNCG